LTAAVGPALSVIVQTMMLAAGWCVAIGYVLYACYLLLGCLGPHFLCLAAYVHLIGRGARLDRPVVRRTSLALELVFCLLNPVLYLLVFQPALFRVASPPWFVAVEWALLATYWLLRVVGARVAATRRLLHYVLLGCGTLVIAVGVRDAVMSFHPDVFAAPDGITVWMGGLIAPLYLLPLIAAFLAEND